MPRNNPTKATLRNKVRTRYKPLKTPLFITKLKRIILREKSAKPSSIRPPRARKAAR